MSTSLSTRIRPLEHLGTHGWWIQIESPSSVQLNPPQEESARQFGKKPAEIVDTISISDVNAMLVTLATGTAAIGLISLGLLNVCFTVITYGLVDLLRLFSGMP